MKKSLLILNLFLFVCLVSAQKVYQVKSGDTLYNISKTHNVSIEELYNMNPELEQGGLKEGDEIVLSSNQTSKGKLVYTTVPETAKVQAGQYQVKSGDTLYAISKKFGLSVEELEQINTGLTPENLKEGQVLNVTKPASSVDHTQHHSASVANAEYYTVVKGDTFYSLTKRFKTDETTLKAYNPVLVNGLKAGQQIYFPQVEEGFITHKVQKGETIFSIVRKYNVSLAVLLEHNPELKNGLKAGMELKIPVGTIKEDVIDDDYLNIVYILPFNTENYKTSEKRSLTTTEFYMGSLFALDSLAKKGKKIKVRTYDNKATLKETQAIAGKINFDEVDLIIGPLRSDNVHWMADYVKDKKIKVISPFSRSVDVTNRENLIKANLTQEVLIEELSDKIRVKNQWDSIYIIGNDNPELRVDLEKEFKDTHIEQITSIKEYDFTKMSQKSTVVLNTINTFAAKSALQKMYDAKIQDQKIEVFAIGYNAAYIKARGVNKDFMGYEMLKELGLVALIPNYFDDTKHSVYLTKYNYRKENEAFPDKYSSAGFDWTYYMILNNEFKKLQQVQEGLFNKIDLKKLDNGGYINKGLFIVRY